MLIAVKTKRQSITMWALLVWAYKRHMVRYEVDRAFELRSAAPGRQWALLMKGRGYAVSCLGIAGEFHEDRGCINGAGTSAHSDAHVVHAHVLGLGRRERELIIASAEAGAPPEWNPYIEPCRIVPKRKGGTGAIERLWSRSGNVVGCRIEYVGVPDEEAEMIRVKARETYDLWWHAILRLRSAMWVEKRLTLWKVSQTGVAREPWSEAY